MWVKMHNCQIVLYFIILSPTIFISLVSLHSIQLLLCQGKFLEILFQIIWSQPIKSLIETTKSVSARIAICYLPLVLGNIGFLSTNKKTLRIKIRWCLLNDEYKTKWSVCVFLLRAPPLSLTIETSRLQLICYFALVQLLKDTAHG